MQIDLSFDEVRSILLRDRELPGVTSLTCDDDTVLATIDLKAIPHAPTAVKLAAAVSPQVHATAKVESFVDPILTLRVTATAAKLPVHKLLGLVEGPLTSVLAQRGLPKDAVDIVTGDGDPLVKVDVNRVIAAKNPDVHVRSLTLKDGHLTILGDGDLSFLRVADGDAAA